MGHVFSAIAGRSDWWYTSRMRGFALLSVLAVAACGAQKPPVDPSQGNAKEDMSSDWSASAPTPPAAKESSSESSVSSETSSPSTASSSTVSPSTTPGGSGSKGGSSSPSKSGGGASDAPAAHVVDNGPHVPVTVGGAGFDRGSIEVVLKRAARQVKANCGAATDDSGSASGPWGKATVTVKLGHNGHSKSGTIAAPFDGKPTGNCAIKAFGNLIYEPFAGGDADVDWPVEIVKP